MAISIEGGTIFLRDDFNVKGDVVCIDFLYAHRVNGQTPLRAEGTVTLDNPPLEKNFLKGDFLMYKDPITGKNIFCEVLEVLASSKYELMRVD